MNFFNKKNFLYCIIVLVFQAGISQPAFAAVTVSNLFTSHMVLQRNVVVPIWGKAASGEQVTVTYNGQTKTIATGTNGLWKVQLDPMTAGGPFTMTIKGTNTLSVTDVYVGVVWQCAGQSNMDTRLSFYANLADTITKANYPLLRYYTLRQNSNPVQTTVWAVCSPTTAGQLSALGFFFGREILNQLNGIAVGLVVTAVGGTFIEQWLDPVTYAADSLLRKTDTTTDTGTGGMYRRWVSTVAGYAMEGTVWIQGEQNCTALRSIYYADRFKAIINGWRAAWGIGTFPFYFGQLSNNYTLQTIPNDTGYVAKVREGQRLALALPKTAMSVNIDIGVNNNWHFPNKPEAGRRLSLPAKALVYGQSNLVYSGPMYSSKSVQGNTINLIFKNIGGGLVAKGGALTGFAIAADTGKYVWGTAVIHNDTVSVTSSAITNPTKVLYAWADNPICNLYNAEGLPASPFSTESQLILPVSIAQVSQATNTSHAKSIQTKTNSFYVNAMGRQMYNQKITGTQMLWNKVSTKGNVVLQKNSQH